MPTQIKVWEIDAGKLVSRDNGWFGAAHKEKELENWIAQPDSDILGEKLLVIARQLVTDAGVLDLLCMDENGKLVIVELKRDLLPREAVAQALDYASWLNGVPEEEILAYANHYLQEQSGDTETNLNDSFEEKFGRELTDWVCQNHRILLVATGLDASAERIINYLAQKQIGINALFFNYRELSGQKQILVRSVLVPDSVNPVKTGGATVVTEAALMAMANEKKTVGLVNICRQMRDTLQEQPRGTFKGSFRYWADPPHVMVFGINVAGNFNPPIGELDVWVRTDTLAAISRVPELTVKQKLSEITTPLVKGKMDFVLRLKNTKDAELLVAHLKELLAEQTKRSDSQHGLLNEVSCAG